MTRFRVEMLCLRTVLALGLLVGVILVAGAALIAAWDLGANLQGIGSTLLDLRRKGGLEVGITLIVVFGVIALVLVIVPRRILERPLLDKWQRGIFGPEMPIATKPFLSTEELANLVGISQVTGGRDDVPNAPSAEFDPAQAVSLSGLTPDTILKKIDSTLPLHRGEARANYVGLSVSWRCRLEDMEKQGDLVIVRLRHSADRRLAPTIMITIKASEYRGLGLLEEGALVVVDGVIETIETLWFEIRVKKLRFVDNESTACEDQACTPWRDHCSRWQCTIAARDEKADTKLRPNASGFWCCPRCSCSYGKKR